MEGGGAEIASLHGCNLLEQRTTPWMEEVERRRMPKPRSSYRGANFCRPIADIYIKTKSPIKVVLGQHSFKCFQNMQFTYTT